MVARVLQVERDALLAEVARSGSTPRLPSAANGPIRRLSSPVPGRSTLMTRAPASASMRLHVGPARTRGEVDDGDAVQRVAAWSGSRWPWGSVAARVGHGGATWFLLWWCSRDADWQGLATSCRDQRAVGVEVLQVAALGARGRVDEAVDDGRLAAVQGLPHGGGDRVRVLGVVALAAEGLGQLFVAARLQQHGRRGVGRVRG